MFETTAEYTPLPADDLTRGLALTQLESPSTQHVGLVGDTYRFTAP